MTSSRSYNHAHHALRVSALFVALCLGIHPGASEKASLPIVFLHEDFENVSSLKDWSGGLRLAEGYKDGHALVVENHADNANSSKTVSAQLPVQAMRGHMVRVTAMVRGENIGRKPNPWNGVKCMLAIETPDGNQWPQAEIGIGTFEWRRAAFTAHIPTNATNVRLVLGLEQVDGKAWFDNVKIVSVRAPADPKEIKVFPRFYKGHDLPRLRGAMVSPNIDAEGLRVLGRDWNANLIRWQLVRQGRQNQPISMVDYDAWLETELKKLDAALPFCQRYGLYVVVDLHSPPGGKVTSGGYAGSDDRLFTDPTCQRKFVEIWRHIAQRYKDCKVIWGYDLANEPVEDLVEEGCDDWQALAERAARAIRSIDPMRAIIVEPASWGSPDGLKYLNPLPVSNVVYSVHMYVPHAFTHQGVYDSGPPLHYPGTINGKYWDKSSLEKALQPVIEFQQAYTAHIYIGEFSAIRWAPGDSAYRYLKDLIEIFEAHGWDWTYHAFREWHGWSVEHGHERTNTKPVESPTDRQLLLLNWYSQNIKPVW